MTVVDRDEKAELLSQIQLLMDKLSCIGVPSRLIATWCDGTKVVLVGPSSDPVEPVGSSESLVDCRVAIHR